MTVIIRWTSVLTYTTICYLSQNPRVQRRLHNCQLVVFVLKQTESFPSSILPWFCLPFVHVVFQDVLYVLLLVLLCVLLRLSCVYLLYCVCIVVFTLDAGLLARSQYSEGPATSHLDTSFSWFPSVYKQRLIWFPTFQVATTCFLCSPPDLNLLVTNFIIRLCTDKIALKFT